MRVSLLKVTVLCRFIGKYEIFNTDLVYFTNTLLFDLEVLKKLVIFRAFISPDPISDKNSRKSTSKNILALVSVECHQSITVGTSNHKIW